MSQTQSSAGEGIEFGLHVETAEETESAVGYLDDGRFVLHVSSQPEPLTSDASAVPLQLALLVALGPRPAPAPAAPVLVGDMLTGAGRAAVLGAVPAADRVGTPLESDDVMIWSAWATWPSDEGSVSSMVSVADAGDGGIALIENDTDGLLIRPCTAAEVWFELAELLPREFELAGHVVELDAGAQAPDGDGPA